MSVIAITDYFKVPDVEREILGDLVGTQVGDDTVVLLVWHRDITGEYVDRLPALRGVQRYGVGYDNLDLSALQERGIVACNNPDYGVDEVSDTAVAMILNIVRGVSTYDQAARAYRSTWQENVNPAVKRTSETVLGVVGAGRIGGSVLLKCRALGFQTVFFDPYRPRGYEKMLKSRRLDSLDELLAVSDVVSVHTPLNAETRGVINAAFIKAMKPGGALVNTGRGGLLEGTECLVEALHSGHLAGVALDVLPQEPPPNDALISAWRLGEEWLGGRLIINPHTSYYSAESYRELRVNAARNALRIYENRPPYNLLY
ncbi:MAG: C-terminal binding protein [Puniceicoccaceae bacterium]|nr:MAG: C-terminal binding protein [Puniceicoccaceae bacterium]